MFELKESIQNEQVLLPVLKEKGVQLFVKREDLIHPFVSGNKFRKLTYNIAKAKELQKETLLTFGGAFSNHILATAVAGKMAGLRTIGIIRGEELGKDLAKTLASNATLQKASEVGMTFAFVSRESYREKTRPSFLASLKAQYGDFYLVPEGGTNELAIKGCEEILTKEDEQFDYICCCVGTGGTISGLIKSAKKHQQILGFPALKGGFLKDEIKRFAPGKENWKLISDYSFGGYAKYSESLIHCINEFKEQTGIPLDPVYTGKMMFGVLEMIQQDQIPVGAKVLAIHTGGLQGIEGFNQRLQKKGSHLKIDL